MLPTDFTAETFGPGPIDLTALYHRLQARNRPIIRQASVSPLYPGAATFGRGDFAYSANTMRGLITAGRTIRSPTACKSPLRSHSPTVPTDPSNWTLG